MSFDLVSARLNRGKSRKAMAREIGVHEHSLKRLETGQTVLPSVAKKVADYYGVNVTDIDAMKVAA